MGNFFKRILAYVRPSDTPREYQFAVSEHEVDTWVEYGDGGRTCEVRLSVDDARSLRDHLDQQIRGIEEDCRASVVRYSEGFL